MTSVRRIDRFWNEAPRLTDTWAVLVLALAARCSVAWWSGGRFPPAEDGAFYHVVAERIARGLGYTWLWPDGAVTYAAHYPVGYPAILGLAYAWVGASPVTAMGVNAVIGSAGALAVHRIAAGYSARGGALCAGIAVALHPGLCMYTPALMTEGVTAALLAVCGWICVATARSDARRGLGFAVLATVLGIATLVRPQSLLLAPAFGALAYGTPSTIRCPAWLGRTLAACGITLGVIAVCLPWTWRNCTKMERCVFVSANGGWNLLIGTAREGHGAWVALDTIGVPEACREVFGEADKDACFRGAALERIAEAPMSWLSLIPAKLGATFDFSSGPGYYLQSSNPSAFDETSKLALNSLQTIYDRALVGLALLAASRGCGAGWRWRRRLAVAAGLFLLSPWAWVAYVGFVAVVALHGRKLGFELPLALAASVVATTAIVHAAFFGAGRYALVCVTLLAVLVGPALAGVRTPRSEPGA